MQSLFGSLEPPTVVRWQDARQFVESNSPNAALIQTREKCFSNPDYPSCDTCRSGCDQVIAVFYDSGAIKFKCPECGNWTKGGKYHVGLSDVPPVQKKKPFQDSVFAPEIRDAILKRDSMRCVECRASCDDAGIFACHIVAPEDGGPSTILNGVSLCRACRDRDARWSDAINKRKYLSHACRCFFLEKNGRQPYAFETLAAVGRTVKAWGVDL